MRGGKIRPDLLGRLAEILEVGPDQIRRHEYKYRQDRLAWSSEPIRPT